MGDERYHDRLTYDGRWENNVYQFMKLVLPKFTFDLPRPFRMEGMKRIDDTPQHKAVREAFTNAIIHADVFQQGGVLRIDKYDDRLVLRNPGTLRLPVEKIYEGGTSLARNPRIQNMLRMIGYGENLGSGFPMIMDAWRKAGWGEPVLKNQIDLDEVELSLPVKASGGIQKITLKSTGKSTLKGTKKNIVEIMDNNPTVTIPQIAEQLKLHPRGIAKHIKTLQDQSVIRRIGGDKGGHWVVIED